MVGCLLSCALKGISVRFSTQLMVIAFNISPNFRFVVDIGAAHWFLGRLMDAGWMPFWEAVGINKNNKLPRERFIYQRRECSWNAKRPSGKCRCATRRTKKSVDSLSDCAGSASAQRSSRNRYTFCRCLEIWRPTPMDAWSSGSGWVPQSSGVPRPSTTTRHRFSTLELSSVLYHSIWQSIYRRSTNLPAPLASRSARNSKSRSRHSHFRQAWRCTASTSSSAQAPHASDPAAKWRSPTRPTCYLSRRSLLQLVTVHRMYYLWTSSINHCQPSCRCLWRCWLLRRCLLSLWPPNTQTALGKKNIFRSKQNNKLSIW